MGDGLRSERCTINKPSGLVDKGMKLYNTWVMEWILGFPRSRWYGHCGLVQDWPGLDQTEPGSGMGIIQHLSHPLHLG